MHVTLLTYFYYLITVPSSQINIKYCCSTTNAVNFSRELVLENEIRGYLKVLEKSLNFSIKR